MVPLYTETRVVTVVWNTMILLPAPQRYVAITLRRYVGVNIQGSRRRYKGDMSIGRKPSPVCLRPWPIVLVQRMLARLGLSTPITCNTPIDEDIIPDLDLKDLCSSHWRKFLGSSPLFKVNMRDYFRRSVGTSTHCTVTMLPGRDVIINANSYHSYSSFRTLVLSLDSF